MPQDDTEAMRWLVLAAELEQMEAEFGRYGWEQNRTAKRNLIAEKMTPSRIAEAQSLSQECFAQHYKNCSR